MVRLQFFLDQQLYVVLDDYHKSDVMVSLSLPSGMIIPVRKGFFCYKLKDEDGTLKQKLDAKSREYLLNALAEAFNGLEFTVYDTPTYVEFKMLLDNTEHSEANTKEFLRKHTLKRRVALSGHDYIIIEVECKGNRSYESLRDENLTELHRMLQKVSIDRKKYTTSNFKDFGASSQPDVDEPGFGGDVPPDSEEDIFEQEDD